jgi:AcrR family transcriptional regulator
MTKSSEHAIEQQVPPRDALLDAAERLLVREGYAAVTTRRVATEAGLNHGLIHYYFGSMEELLVQVLERFTGPLVDRQRQMYAQDAPFIEKWRTAMAYLESDQASGYQKIWLELQAMAWNHPDLRERVAAVNAEWRAVLTDAFEGAAREHGVDVRRFPVPALVSLVMTFNEGIILERLCGINDGQAELLTAIDGWLQELGGGKA